MKPLISFIRRLKPAVFQVESQGMMDALKRMKPTCIEDIVALVALYRPGPMENIPAYCEVKNGLKERTSIHPLIDDIEETQGIIVYQSRLCKSLRLWLVIVWEKQTYFESDG